MTRCCRRGCSPTQTHSGTGEHVLLLVDGMSHCTYYGGMHAHKISSKYSSLNVMHCDDPDILGLLNQDKLPSIDRSFVNKLYGNIGWA